MIKSWNKSMVCASHLFTAPCTSAEEYSLRLLYCSGSQLEKILSPGEHLAMSENVFWLSQSGKVPMASGEQRPVLVTQLCLTLRPQELQPAKLLCAWKSPGKNTGAGSHSLLQGIFPTQQLNQGLLCCRLILYHLSRICLQCRRFGIQLLNFFRSRFPHL